MQYRRHLDRVPRTGRDPLDTEARGHNRMRRGGVGRAPSRAGTNGAPEKVVGTLRASIIVQCRHPPRSRRGLLGSSSHSRTVSPGGTAPVDTPTYSSSRRGTRSRHHHHHRRRFFYSIPFNVLNYYSRAVFPQSPARRKYYPCSSALYGHSMCARNRPAALRARSATYCASE